MIINETSKIYIFKRKISAASAVQIDLNLRGVTCTLDSLLFVI